MSGTQHMLVELKYTSLQTRLSKHISIDDVFQKGHIQRTDKFHFGTKSDAFSAVAAPSVFQ